MIFLGKKAAAGAAFDPSDLFASSEVGFWFDASDLSTLWQDTAATSAVTADGQSVARADDKSGNGAHSTQTTGSRRPLYKTSGGVHWVLFDGVDDLMEFTNNITGTADHSVFIGCRSLDASQTVTERTLTLGDPDSAGGPGRLFTSEIALRVGGGNEVYNAAAEQNADRVVSHILVGGGSPNATNNRCWRDGTELGVSSSTSQSMNTSTAGAWGGDFNGYPNVRIHQIIAVADDKSSDRASVVTWIGAKQGRSL